MSQNNEYKDNDKFFNTHGMDKPVPKMNMDPKDRLNDIYRRAEENCTKKYPGIEECLSLISSVDYRTCKTVLKELEKCVNDEKLKLMDDISYFRKNKMFTQTWHGGKNFSLAANPRSLTPKTGYNRKEEKTPDKVPMEYAQLLSYTPSPHFHHGKSPSVSPSLTPKTQRKPNEIIGTPEKEKSPTVLRESQKHIRGSSTNLAGQLRVKNLNTEELPTVMSSSYQNNENNYLNQINKMLQKIAKLKKEVEIHQDKEMQYATKLNSLEKENKSLQAVIDDKDKKIQEILKKAKQDKLKMYNFLKEFEAYKEKNRENTSKELKTESSICPGGESFRAIEKSFISKVIQTDEAHNTPCHQCENFKSQTDFLVKKLNHTEDSLKNVTLSFNALKGEYENICRSESNYLRTCNELEKKNKDLQKTLLKQENINSEINSENSMIKASLRVVNSERNGLKSRDANSQSIISPIPSSLRAIMIASKQSGSS